MGNKCGYCDDTEQEKKEPKMKKASPQQQGGGLLFTLSLKCSLLIFLVVSPSKVIATTESTEIPTVVEPLMQEDLVVTPRNQPQNLTRSVSRPRYVE